MRKIIALFVCIILIGALGINIVNAATLDLAAFSLSKDEKTAFLNRIDWNVVEEDSHHNGIVGFDVKENGTYALAYSDKAVCVYDESHMLLYGYRFHADGDFGISFQEDWLAICFLREQTIVLLDKNGNCVDIQRVSDAAQYASDMKELLNRTTKTLGHKTYTLERNLDIGNSYSRFVVDESGKRTVVCDISNEHSLRQIFTLATAICFFAIVIWGMIRKAKRQQQ